MKIHKTETRGRKPKALGEKIMRSGLTEKQWSQLRKLAEQYKLPVAYVHRQAVDWFLDAIVKNGQSSSAATKEEDRKFEELTS